MSSPLTSGIRRAAMQLVLPGILAMLTVSTNAIAMIPTVPVPNGPGPIVDLLKWCWEHRDITRYRDLFTADFQFQSGTDALWNRDDELATVGKLFGPGNGTQPGATIVTLDFLGAPQPGSYLPPGKPWPWHQQVLAPIILDIQRTDGSHLHAAGLTLFYLVRGDYASIPTDMQDRGFKPDSTRWYVERWEDEPGWQVNIDHAPLITVPSVVTAYVGRSLTLDVTAADPEEDPVVRLTANPPPGATFSAGPDNTTGRLTWLPTEADVGTFPVTFVASNQLWSSATTTINVRSYGLKAALAVNPATGSEPLFVRLDASGTTSPNAVIGRYVFDFGDGSSWTQSYPIITHTYPMGVWTARVTVTDSYGAIDSAKATVDVKYSYQIPTAALTCTPLSGKAPLNVVLDGSRSTGHIVQYKFRFGDGRDTVQSTPVATHTYSLGRPTAVLMVVDDHGDSATASMPLDIHMDRPPVVVAPATWTVLARTQLTLDVSASDPDGDPIASLTASLAGATFVALNGNRIGRLTWVPALGDTGVHRASFTAANALIDSAVTMISVLARPPDRAPVVTAPGGFVIKAGKLLAFTISAFDPDREPIASLSAAVPAGAQFTLGPQNASGTLMWTPGPTDVGPHTATFTAANALSGSAETRIDVLPPNQLPVASLTATPPSGTEPLYVQLSANASHDADGRIVNYRFEFGDGSPAVLQTGPTAAHNYVAGAWRPRVTVYDDDGASGYADVSLQVAAVYSTAGALDAITRLESSWRDRSLARYRELLTSDFRFVFATDDSVGDLYPGRTWTRDDELQAAGRLFSGGNGAEPPASAIDLYADAPLVGTSFVAGREYPWHVQVLVPNVRLDIARGGGSGLHVLGQALFSMVRGDSARIPQELIDLGFHPDSTQWYVEGWRDMTGFTAFTNHPPVASMSLTPGTGIDPVAVRVDASRSRDDDGIIKSYRFDFNDGVVFTQTSPICMHTFHAGQWYVTVTVTDDQGDQSSVGMPIMIWAPGTQPNLARNPSFEVDSKGWNSYAGSLLQRVDGAGHDGAIGLQITGPPVINGSFGVNDSPDMVRWTLSPGIRYRYTAWVRSASSHGLAKLRVTEYLIASGAKLGLATSAPVTLSPDWQQLTVDYTTTSANSTLDFQVRDFPITGSEVFFTDDITIRNVSGPGAGTGMAAWYNGQDDPVTLEPRLSPSPMHGSGTLRFMTSTPGTLRVEVLDLAGRRVRSLVDDRNAPAGLYELPILRVGDDGQRLGAGVYFYRVIAREGVKSGRFVMLQ